MNKTLTHIIAALLLLLAAMPATAQPRLRQAEIYIGVHGGVEATMMQWQPKVSGTDQLLKTVLLGGNGGVVFRYSKHKYFGLQVELDYLQRGWREKIAASDLTAAGTYTRCLHYIELPIMTHIYFGKRRWRGFVNLGPEIGYCFKETHKGTKHPTETNQYKPIDHPFDWGVAGGLGFYYRNPKAGVFQLEVRFMYSLGDVFDNGKRAYFAQSHPMVLSLNVGYLWQIKQRRKNKL